MLLIFLLSCILGSSLCIRVCPPSLSSKSVQQQQVCDSCNLTQALLNISLNGIDETDTVHLEPGHYTLDQVVNFFNNTQGVNIIGNGDPTEITISCPKINVGLTFEVVHNLTIANFTLSNCGQIIQENGILYNTALYITECNDVTVSNVVIANAQGIGLYGANLHGNCVFERVVMVNNTGGGVFLHFQEYYSSEEFYNNHTATSVEFIQCNFTSNAAKFTKSNERNFFSGGGGLKAISSQVNYQVNLRLISSHFHSNFAEYGAGVLLLSRTSPWYHGSTCSTDDLGWNVSIEGCSFVSNNASYGGSALLVTDANSDCTVNTGSVVVVISDCVFMSNSASGNNPPTLNPQHFKGTTVSIEHANISLEGKNEFALNCGTALEVIDSELSVCGHVRVHDNTGTHGGGFRLLGNAYILLHLQENGYCNSSVYFSDNSAYKGSALYVGAAGNDWFSPIVDSDPCFLHFDSVKFGAPSSSECNRFMNVHAPLIVLNNVQQEFAIFGSTLKQCGWTTCVDRNPHDSTVYQNLVDLNIMQTVYVGNSTRIASSLVENVRVYAGNIAVMPGQIFEIGVELLDNFEQVASGVVSAMVVHGDANIYNSGPWFINDQITVIQLSLKGIPDQIITLSVYEINLGVYTEFTVMLHSCIYVLGFGFDPEREQCECDQNLSSEGIRCDLESAAISIPSSIWFGPLSSDNNSILVVTNCVENYCKDGNTNISTADFDFLCKSSRSGIGCGSCASDHSAVLGSSECNKCTNYSLFLIVLFLVTGLLTVSGITFLRITVTEGYLNAVLFYCNVINVYAVYFVPAEHGKGAFFLTAWISQHFGIPACFYDGMTTLEASGLHLLYIVYLLSLTVLLSLLLRCKQLPQSDKFAPSKVVATLLLICYTGLLETCLKIMSFTKVKSLDGELYIRWYFDANVVYFDGLHAALAVFSILIILVYLIPFPFLIISPRMTYKVRFFNKLQPLLDAFWAPFKPKFRWWISFRLFLRWIPYFVVSFVSSASNSIAGIIVLLTILLFVQSLVKPFRVSSQNVFDEALVLNAILLLSGYWFLNSTAIGLEVYSSVLVGVAYLVFGVLFVSYMFYRFPKCKPFLTKLPTNVRNVFTHNEVLGIQEADSEPPTRKFSCSEIMISKQEKEQDKRNLKEEILELESLSAASSSSTHAIVNPNIRVTDSLTADEKSRYKVSVTESQKKDKNSFPLLRRRHSFTEDREPLLAADDDC